MLARKALAGTAGAPKLYVEDVFSTYLYTGTGANQTITNNIDLSTEGGLVWLKSRSNATNNYVYDTETGLNRLITNATNGSFPLTDGLSAFNSNGFSLGNDATAGQVNVSSRTYVSWTFRQAKKFFDVVTYTGNGTAGRTVSHNLGSTPGCLIVKKTSGTDNWFVWHRSLTDATYRLLLNSTAAETQQTNAWNSTAPTSTVFTLGDNTNVNENGATYVAYLFAHDASGFGLAGDQSVIKCGSFTTNSGGAATIDLGWEPQWVTIKASSTTGNWDIIDNMRGFPVSGDDATLRANLSDAEASLIGYASPSATGFSIVGGGNTTYIYIAIRRGPMKTPTTGTSVFSPVARAGTGATADVSAGFVVDSSWIDDRANTVSQGFVVYDRLRGANNRIEPAYTDQEYSTPTNELTSFASNTSVTLGASSTDRYTNYSGYNYINYFFRRAPGFFDVVCYTGTGSSMTLSHNLAVSPELIILKERNASGGWIVYSSPTGFSVGGNLAGNGAFSSGLAYVSATSSTTFTTLTNASTYVAYLFSSVTGVSKVGSYTGTGSTQTINCGFTAGSRFVMVKRTDSTGDWYVWDSARGIVSGNDPYLLLNSTAAEVTNTDYIDTANSGFEISSTAPAAINANGGTFVFLAIA